MRRICRSGLGRWNANDRRWLIVLASGAASCLAAGSLGLVLPLVLCVLWLAELGAME